MVYQSKMCKDPTNIEDIFKKLISGCWKFMDFWNLTKGIMSVLFQIVKALSGGIFLSDLLFQIQNFLQNDSLLHLKYKLFSTRVILWQDNGHFCFFRCISRWLNTKYENVSHFFDLFTIWKENWQPVCQLCALLMPRLELPLIILMTWICLHFRKVTRYTCRN